MCIAQFLVDSFTPHAQGPCQLANPSTDHSDSLLRSCISFGFCWCQANISSQEATKGTSFHRSKISLFSCLALPWDIILLDLVALLLISQVPVQRTLESGWLWSVKSMWKGSWAGHCSSWAVMKTGCMCSPMRGGMSRRSWSIHRASFSYAFGLYVILRDPRRRNSVAPATRCKHRRAKPTLVVRLVSSCFLLYRHLRWHFRKCNGHLRPLASQTRAFFV